MWGRVLTPKAYKSYSGKRRSGRRRVHALAWFSVCFLLVVVGVAAGYYLWLNAKVSAANNRVPEDARQALVEDTSTTARPLNSTTLSPESTTSTEAVPESPDAMNILLVGSDRRSNSGTSYGRSDTIMLVHVDPDNDYLSTISFPRDLRVDLKGYGMQKLNAAYAYGGPALSIRTIRSLTGLHIDHYLGVDFQAFKAMTDKLGGVYVEVDRRYYYNGGAYERIDLQPGYRLLKGADALDFVRFRHDSNLDFGRMERQQRFLSALRQQAMKWDLGLKLPGLVGAFFDNVTTDIGTNDFLKLAWWGIKLDGSRIRQVTLRGTTQTIAGASYVLASKSAIADAVAAFLTVPGSEPAGSQGSEATGSQGGSAFATSTTTAAVSDTASTGTATGALPAAAVWKGVAKKMSFAVEAPLYVPKGYAMSRRPPNNATIYKIKGGGGNQPILVMLYKLDGADQYLDLIETAWQDAPAASAGKQVTHDGTVFTVVGTTDKVERVWWKSGSGLYWVANTLSRLASEADLLAMAESMIPVSGQ